MTARQHAGTHRVQPRDMGTYREQDPLTAFLARQQRRVLEAITALGNGDPGASAAEPREVIRALAEAEAQVLYPTFSRVTLDLATERLLEDMRGERAIQLEKLEALAHKRAPALKKLGAVALADAIEHHHHAHASRLIPVLASRLPRPIYRALVGAFISRVESTIPAERSEAEASVRQRSAVLTSASRGASGEPSGASGARRGGSRRRSATRPPGFRA